VTTGSAGVSHDHRQSSWKLRKLLVSTLKSLYNKFKLKLNYLSPLGKNQKDLSKPANQQIAYFTWTPSELWDSSFEPHLH